MTEEEREEYLEELGVAPKKVEEHETGDSDVSVVEEEKEEEKEERGEEELEQYREVSSF